MPLYRRLPKLKGIAGGMGAGLPDFQVVNVGALNAMEAGSEVSLETLEANRVINPSGREAKCVAVSALLKSSSIFSQISWRSELSPNQHFSCPYPPPHALRRLPLKVLGDGELTKALKVHAAAFSAAAKAAIEKAGGEAIVVAQKPKWTRVAHEAAQAAAAL